MTSSNKAEVSTRSERSKVWFIHRLEDENKVREDELY